MSVRPVPDGTTDSLNFVNGMSLKHNFTRNFTITTVCSTLQRRSPSEYDLMDLAPVKAEGHEPRMEAISHTGKAKKDKSKNHRSDPYHKRPTSQKPAPEFSIHSTDFQREGQTELDTAFALHAAGTSTEMQSIWEKGEKAFRDLERQFDPQASSRRFRTPAAAQDAVNAPSTGAGRLTGPSLPMLSTSSRPCSRMDVRAARSLDNSSQTQRYQEAPPQSQRPDQHTLLPAPIPALQLCPSFYAPGGLYVPVSLKRGESLVPTTFANHLSEDIPGPIIAYIASSLSPGELSDLSHAIDALEREHVVLKEQKKTLEETNYILFKQIEELKRDNGTLGTQKARLEVIENQTQTQIRTETRGVQPLDNTGTWKCENLYHDLVQEIERYKALTATANAKLEVQTETVNKLRRRILELESEAKQSAYLIP